MIEDYTSKEVLKCYNDYMKDGKTIGAPVSRYERSLTRKGTIRKKHSMTRVTKG
jgi:hypothetical protein